MTKTCSLSFGDSGKGKTYFVGTMAKFAKVYVIDTEGGLATLKHIDGQFDYRSVDTYQEFADACDWYFKNATKEGYNYLVVDSFTRLQRLLMQKILKSPLGESVGQLNLNPRSITIKEWGEINAAMTSIVDIICRHCPTSVHFTALASEHQDDVSGITKIWPFVQGNFKYQLPGFFDLVLYHSSTMGKGGEIVYHMQTQGCNRIVAKNRMHHMSPLKTIEPNDYEIIHNMLKEL